MKNKKTKQKIMKYGKGGGGSGSGSVEIIEYIVNNGGSGGAIATNNHATATNGTKPKTYKTKNYLEIKQKRQRKKERDELEQKFYKYGFWLLLTAGVVNLILTQI